MKKIISVICLMISSIVFSQNNITNTLGTGGVFSIKDGSTTFFSLSQSDGRITLPVTTSASLGAIFKGTAKFIHDFKPIGADGYNTFMGSNAGNFTMSYVSGSDASYNTGIGNGALLSLTTGSKNTALGFSSLVFNSTGYQNTALGTYSLISNTTGYNNSASGYNSLYSNTTGSFNTASGSESLYSNTSGSFNTASGSHSLYSNKGNTNTAFGFYSLYSNTTGNLNTASGSESLNSNTTGSGNTASGGTSLYFNTTGSSNTAFGYRSLYSNIVGFRNTAVGNYSLEDNTGNYNTALGYNAGSSVTTGANLTLIGIDANPTTGSAINQITLGNQFVSSLRCNVQNIRALSDSRDKKNIEELNLGIDFLMKVQPRLFNWDKRGWYDDNVSDGSKIEDEPTAGFVAQELDELQTTENAEWLNLVLKDNPEKLEATPGNLLPIVVKAIQDLKRENDELKAENVVLANRLNKFEQMQNTLVTKIEKLRANNNENTKVSLGD